MLAIQSSQPQKCTPNLLPAQLNRNGRINDTHRYWKPKCDDNGKPHAYFRGRHLHGTPLPLPANYTGAVLHITDKDLPQTQSQHDRGLMDEEDEEDEEEEEKVNVTVAEQVGEFDEVMVWGHGGEVDKEQDSFARGVDEWVDFAEAMHGVEEDEGEEGKKG